MEGPVIKFGQFTVAQLLEHFFISAQPPGVESQALRFMFAVLGDELPKNTTNQAVQNTATQEIAIEKIEFRFDMLREHAENFLPRKHKPDMAALTLAVICDEYLEYAAPPQDVEVDGSSPLHAYLDHDTVYRAMTIWDEAVAIESSGLREDTPVSGEALLLAHINAMQHLRELEQDFDEYEPAELLSALQKELAPIPAFAVWDFDLGQVLLECYDDMKDRITQVQPAAASLPAAVPAATPRPALRLVADNDPAP